MMCSHCGNQLTQDARFCSRCGNHIEFVQVPVAAQAPMYAVPMVPSYAGRVVRHVQTLGILWAVYAGWRLLTKTTGLVFMHGFLAHSHIFDGTPLAGTDFASAIFPVAMVSLLFSVALCGITAYALLTRQSWGRVFGIVCGVLALLHPITGTALGIYTLWVLAPGVSGDEYAALTTPVPQA